MTKIICTSIAFLLVILVVGCRKAPTALIVRALASTNVVFQAYDNDRFTLSERDGDTVKHMVKQFQDPSRVEVRKEILPAYSGSFILGDVWFGWVGSLLCLKDPNAERYYVIQDAALAPMAEALMKAWGPPPAHAVSKEQWHEILAAINTRGGAEPDGPANRSQPIRSNTNSTSGTAGSHR